MANQKEWYRRLRVIHQKLSTFEEGRVPIKVLVEACKVSERTILSDIKSLIEDFDAPIINDKSKHNKGYYYSEAYELPAIENLPLLEKDLHQLSVAAETLNQFEGLTIFREFRGVIQKLSNAIKYKIFKNQTQYSNNPVKPTDPVIHFETVPYSAGSQHIAFFYEAIKKQQAVSFSYKKFEGDDSKQHVIHPYWLKEHKNKWYIIGENLKYNDFNTFGLDRIQGTPVPGAHFRRKNILLSDLMKFSYGLFVSTDSPETIVLSMTPLRGKYFKAQPMFKRYKVIADNNQEFRIQTQLIVNTEFIMDLARLGASVKVLEPASLQQKVIKYLAKATEEYGIQVGVSEQTQEK